MVHASKVARFFHTVCDAYSVWSFRTSKKVKLYEARHLVSRDSQTFSVGDVENAVHGDDHVLLHLPLDDTDL